MKFKKFIKESIEDMDKRCPECNTLLNDSGTCPKCDDGEEDYGDELNEGVGADIIHKIKEFLTPVAESDENGWATTITSIVDNIPDNTADDLFDAVKTKFGTVRVKDSDKEGFSDSTGLDIPETEDTLEDIFDFAEENNVTENPDATKAMVVAGLTVASIIEPTPVLEMLTSYIAKLPSNVVAKIVNVLNKLGLMESPISGFTRTVKTIGSKLAPVEEEVKCEELSNLEKLKRAYPELNFDNTLVEDAKEEPVIDDTIVENTDASEESAIQESIEEELTNIEKLKRAYPELDLDESVETEDDIDEYSDYDDDYSFDDVEEDHIHAALYGGDLTYCKDCGSRLERNEWGSYCPECDAEDRF